MTLSSIQQPLNNLALASQSGGTFVAKATVTVKGGDALIGVSASGWSANPGPISMIVWVDNQPTGAVLGTYASAGGMHLALGHTWAWCRGLTPGQHTIMLEAGPTTVTDQNDFACVTVWEMGDVMKVHFSEDTPSPKGVAVPLITQRSETGDDGVLISGSSSGWVGVNNTLVGSAIVYDGGDGAPMEVFANNANQHLTVVPTDSVMDTNRGDHLFELRGGGQSMTDLTDYAHLSMVEFVNIDQAPKYLSQITNAPAQATHGDGGTIASVPVTTKGGTLLVKVGVSAFATQANQQLIAGIQVDGVSKGFARVFANPAETHMAMVTNDLVVTGVPAGSHTLGLISEANTYTDGNDRVSVLVLEFPPS